MEVRSPFDTYHILYKHDTSKVSTTLLIQMLPPSLTLLVVKCVIPFMLLIQQREIKLCLSVCLSQNRMNREDLSIRLAIHLKPRIICDQNG